MSLTRLPGKGRLTNTNARLLLASIPASILGWQRQQEQPGLSILLLGCNLFLCRATTIRRVVIGR